MSGRNLENINNGYTWTSYISSAYGVLSAAGMWKDDVSKLMGMTGMAFHFIVHKTCCPSSVTVYDWVNEHWAMMDRVGVHSDVYQVCFDSRINTYELKQKDAVIRIKESIDRGIGVVVWAPSKILEFGVITGYDDEDRVFFVKDCTGQNVDPLLYQNLGKSDVPLLFHQIFKEKVEVDKAKVYRESLQFAVAEWNKEFHVNPDYSSGRKGYDNLLAALENDSFDTFGLGYIISVYLDARTNAAKYLRFLSDESKEFDGLDKAAALYEQIADRFGKMSGLYPFSGENGAGSTADRSRAPELLVLARECRTLEDEAMQLIAKALK
jgi:hypothetical protein